MGNGGFNGQFSLVAEKHNGGKCLQDLDGGTGGDTQRAKAIGSVWNIAGDTYDVAAVTG